MSSLNAIRVAFEPQRSSAFGAIIAGYSAVGTPLLNAAYEFKIDNATDALLQFSIDGVTNHFVLPANSSWINDNNTNRSGEAKGFFLAKGTTLYVKRIGTPGSGSVYFSVMYGQDQN